MPEWQEHFPALAFDGRLRQFFCWGCQSETPLLTYLATSTSQGKVLKKLVATLPISSRLIP